MLRPLFLYETVEFHAVYVVGTLRKPHFAARQPYVGKFRLPAVDDFLLEQPVFVTDRKAHRGVISRGKRVQKARGKSAESAVTQPRVRLQFVKFRQRYAVRFQNFFICFAQFEVIKTVFQRTPHQKFHAKIIYALRAFCFAFFVKLLTFFQHDIAYVHHHGFVNLVLRGFFRRNAEITRKLAVDHLFQFVFRQMFFHAKNTAPWV